jgi:hypothetical protein
MANHGTLLLVRPEAQLLMGMCMRAGGLPIDEILPE